MRSKLLLSALLVLMIAFTATASQACTRKLPAGAAQTVVPKQRINQALFDASVRAEVNYHRCRARLTQLGDAGDGLDRQTATHSAWMAKAQTLSHENSIAGKSSLDQRFKASGIRYTIGSENIGVVNRYQLNSQRFKVIDQRSCKFSRNGRVVAPHSYETLARQAVSLWMNSPSHRKNILDPRVSHVSSAVAFDPNSRYGGRFYRAQNFIG